MNPTENFGDFIRRVRRQKNLSCADVSRQSARFGKRIAGSYVNRIENDPNLRPSVDRLVALAHGLDVPVEELLARAIRSTPSRKASDDELRLLARFSELSPQRRMDILAIIDLWYSERTKLTLLRAVTEQENR
jgi:transcriptional regulator with XRE-family HTH domain